ncbi:MAG: DUF4126 domain-containing protein [Acidobacteriota bacterium]
MDFINTLAFAMGSSWLSGIKLYAMVATLGLLGRFAHLQLPGELGIVTNWWVIGVAGGLFVIEFIADKVAYVDSLWDTVHTFIRIPAGAALAALAFGDYDKGVQVIALLLGGGIALSSHGTKATSRMAINTSPEPVTNIGASLFEDILAIGSTFLTAYFPFLIIGLVGVAVIIAIIILPKILRFLRRVMKKVRGWFSASEKQTSP